MDLSNNGTSVITPPWKQNFPFRNFLLGLVGLTLITISFTAGLFLAPKTLKSEDEVPSKIFTAKLVFGRVREIERKNLLLEEQKERYWVSLRQPLKVILVKTITAITEIESLAGIATDTGEVQTEENPGVFEDIKIDDFVFVGDLILGKNAEHLLNGGLVKIIRRQ